MEITQNFLLMACKIATRREPIIYMATKPFGVFLMTKEMLIQKLADFHQELNIEYKAMVTTPQTK
jgi:hypothetical protein